jgi:hypothetical protein
VNSETVTVRCTIIDNDSVAARRDPDFVITPNLTFVVVRKPTINISVTPVPEDEMDIPSPASPSSSGLAANAGVRLKFEVTQRAGSWGLIGTDVSWNTHWHMGTGLVSLTPGRIPSNETHARYDFSATATFKMSFYLPYPPYYTYITSTDAKTRSAPLCFDKTSHHENTSTDRGQSDAPGSPHNPPNWFDNLPNHWGSFIGRFNETDANLQPTNHIVYYAPSFLNISHLFGYTDYFADHAPRGTPDHRYDPAYRGRIYLLDQNLDYKDGDSTQPASNIAYTPRAGGIDFMAQVVAHEFSHRDLFILPDNWGGFSTAQIGGIGFGGPGFFYPRNPDPAWGDEDIDAIRSTFEDLHLADYHFNRTNRFNTEQWWTGNIGLTSMEDSEMYARLWGSWLYVNGTHDEADWSVLGRNTWLY